MTMRTTAGWNPRSLMLARPTYGTRKMAARLASQLGVPANQKKVSRIYRHSGHSESAIDIASHALVFGVKKSDMLFGQTIQCLNFMKPINYD